MILLKFTNLFSSICLLFVTFLCVAACNQKKKSVGEGQSFREALQIHLNAVQNRKINELKPTVAKDVSLILPVGEKKDSKQVFIEFHKNWFQQGGWTWEGNILKTESVDSLGYGLIRYTYTKKDFVGKIVSEKNAYLVLIFRNSADGWQLIHDQNTSIQYRQK